MISDRLKAELLSVLALEDFDFEDATLASSVPGWDSLKHIEVIAAIERAYAIRFKTLEVLRLKNIGDLQRLV
ncbi:MAG TPA: acyl carrier protein, partial [Polyangiales bacterium]|nr:acyl carrier protein [Polyangiales bacterium]